jgi:hypothetical protein
MSIEPGDVDLIAPAFDFSPYGLCRLCRAEPGQPCHTVYDAIVDGRPGGPPRSLNIAHGHRRRRPGR